MRSQEPQSGAPGNKRRSPHHKLPCLHAFSHSRLPEPCRHVGWGSAPQCPSAWQPRTRWKRSFPNNNRKCAACIPGTVSQKSTIWHIWLLEGSAHRAVGMRLIIFTFCHGSQTTLGTFDLSVFGSSLLGSLPEETTKREA